MNTIVKWSLVWTLIFGLIIAGIYVNIRFSKGPAAIVDAKVLVTREDNPGRVLLPGTYLSIINITKAYPSSHPIWSTRSDCPLANGQTIDVRVATDWFNTPTSANTTLYKSASSVLGPDSQFIPWNGCQ